MTCYAHFFQLQSLNNYTSILNDLTNPIICMNTTLTHAQNIPALQ